MAELGIDTERMRFFIATAVIAGALLLPSLTRAEVGQDGMMPPDMAKVCTTVMLDASTTQQTCEDPIFYYAGNILDIIIVLAFATVTYRFVR